VAAKDGTVNSDIAADLKRLAESVDFGRKVERGMRRNLLRSLSLDAFAAALSVTDRGVTP